jgi:ligand-binding sensor domain-containing protein
MVDIRPLCGYIFLTMIVPRSFYSFLSSFPPGRSVLTALLIAALLVQCTALHSQTLLLKDYTVLDGLPDSRVAPILQDRSGYIWFGTQAGLTRYDGKVFVNYGPAREIPGIFGRSILEDHTGALWFGYSGFARGGITRVADPITIDCTNGLSGKQVYQVAEDGHGDFWVATSAGLEHVRFGDSTRKTWTVQTLRDTALMMVHAEADGKIWFAGSDRGRDNRCRLPQSPRQSALARAPSFILQGT